MAPAAAGGWGDPGHDGLPVGAGRGTGVTAIILRAAGAPRSGPTAGTCPAGPTTRIPAGFRPFRILHGIPTEAGETALRMNPDHAPLPNFPIDGSGTARPPRPLGADHPSPATPAAALPAAPRQPSATAARRQRGLALPLWLLMLALLALAGGGWWWFAGRGGAQPGAAPADAAAAAGGAASRGPGRGGADANRPTPVVAQPASEQPLDLSLTALGTVTARSTVTVHVRVDGELNRVAFREGQLVRAGELLAVVDPRPFEVSLQSARAQLQRDQAQLQNARVDMERYRGLVADDSIPKQQLDTQVSLVAQLEGTVAADQAAVDSAALQLSYTRVTAPVGGRVGLRQVDAGNIVHAADTAGLVVITEVQPIAVIFPVPQDALPGVLDRLRTGGRLAVDALDRDGKAVLASGRLLTTDNLIDTTTGTVKLKAEFPNRDGSLFPNQFVNVKLHLQTLPRALTIPTAAVLRGAPGLYAYVVGKDGTVSMHTVKLGATDGDRVQVLDGLAVNDQVVVDGTDKLREGAKVELLQPGAPAGGGQRGGQRRAGAP